MDANPGFIENLLIRKSRYLNPEQPQTLYQALLQLSSGIYAEEERFVYELLQNADDAHENDGPLRIRILIKDGYFVFTHNGKPFDERDIEGICDIGNGGKSEDLGKIGYKGIGFKSVFHHSNCVSILGPDYRFQFDERYWDGFWDKNWDAKYEANRGTYHMPWQLIPIPCDEAPVVIPQEYPDNVQIFIKARDIDTLAEKVHHLLSDPNILLFLKNDDISIALECPNSASLVVGKKTQQGHTVLTSNDAVVGEWIILTPKPLTIPEEMSRKIASDFNTPDKIKQGHTFELSFALHLEDGKVSPLNHALVYTYLPTSEDLGFPFIVNSNFILDAGRQHLKKDSVWNKYLLSLIPKSLFTAVTDENGTVIQDYPDSWYSILPSKSLPGELFEGYNSEFENTLNEIAIVPNLNGDLMKVGEALADETGLSEGFGEEPIVKYVNERDSLQLDNSSFVSNSYIDVFSSYGIHTFRFKDLNNFFKGGYYSVPTDPDGNLMFIRSLYTYDQKLTERQRASFRETISVIPFILNDKGELGKPKDLHVRSGDSLLNEGLDLLSREIRNHTSSQEDKWLEELGLDTVGDDHFILNTVVRNPEYITKSKAIAIGRLLMEAYYRGVLTPVKDTLKSLPFLTMGSNLVKIEELYLGEAYSPDVNLEAYADSPDMFVSDKYIEKGNAARWKVFLSDLHCASFNGLMEITLKEESWQAFDPETTRTIRNAVRREEYVSMRGDRYSYSYSAFHVHYFPLWIAQSNNFELLRAVMSVVFKAPVPRYNDCILSCTGYIDRYLSLPRFLNNKSFLEYAFDSWQRIPCADGQLHPIKDVLAPKKDIVSIAGKYLPVLAITGIDPSWDSVFHLRDSLTMDDYLSILESVSYETTVEDNSERVMKIYTILAEWLDDERISDSILSEWGETHRLLAEDGQYYLPSELSYIKVQGITSNSTTVYLDNNPDSRILRLMEVFGVKVISPEECSLVTDPVIPETDDTLKGWLLSKASAISILRSSNGLNYRDNLVALKASIRDYSFKSCRAIELQYGNSCNTLSKSAICHDNTFYYVGPLKISQLDRLLSPLCEFLDMPGKERELLFVLIEEDDDAVRNYLRENGYNVTDLEDMKTDEDSHVVNTRLPDRYRDKEMDLLTGFKGEAIVYEYLKGLGYHPTWNALGSPDNYDRCVTVMGKEYYCVINYERFDISFSRNDGTMVYVEVKSTVTSKGVLENMPISNREWCMIDEHETDYYIARVFATDSGSPEIYFLKGSRSLKP